MKYVFLFIAGAAAGIAGGMGMGGGTILIPLLTLFFGMGQIEAQAVNLISFIPMSAAALFFHIRKGLVDFGNILYIILPAAAFAAAFSYMGGNIEGEAIKRVFGGFLILLAIVQFVSGFFISKSAKAEKV